MPEEQERKESGSHLLVVCIFVLLGLIVLYMAFTAIVMAFGEGP